MESPVFTSEKRTTFLIEPEIIKNVIPMTELPEDRGIALYWTQDRKDVAENDQTQTGGAPESSRARRDAGKE